MLVPLLIGFVAITLGLKLGTSLIYYCLIKGLLGICVLEAIFGWLTFVMLLLWFDWDFYFYCVNLGL